MPTFRRGRLVPGFFKRDVEQPSTGYVEAHVVPHINNATWFAVDTETGRANGLYFRDFRTNNALALRERLQSGEAVLVVSEEGWRELEGSLRSVPQGRINDLTFDLPLVDVVNAAFCLVTADRVYVSGRYGTDFVLHAFVERVPTLAAFRALLA